MQLIIREIPDSITVSAASCHTFSYPWFCFVLQIILGCIQRSRDRFLCIPPKTLSTTIHPTKAIQFIQLRRSRQKQLTKKQKYVTDKWSFYFY
jgi:hypothetical protein